METSRRDFLKMTGSGALILGVSPVLGACAGIIRSDITREMPQEVHMPELEAGMAEILTLASLAPSGHNMQPWQVKRLKPYEYMIGMDKARLLPAVDPDNREVILSIGAFVENLSLAASSMGFETHVEVIGKCSSDEYLVKVTLTKVPPSDFPISRITSRRTVKNGYLTKALSADHARVLSDVWPGHICKARGRMDDYHERRKLRGRPH